MIGDKVGSLDDMSDAQVCQVYERIRAQRTRLNGIEYLAAAAAILGPLIAIIVTLGVAAYSLPLAAVVVAYGYLLAVVDVVAALSVFLAVARRSDHMLEQLQSINAALARRRITPLH
jgi:hypothetical protein